MKSIFRMTIFVLVCLISISCSKKSEESQTDRIQSKVIKFGIGENEDHFLYQSAVAFKETVEKGTNGSLTVELYPAGLLGNDRETLEAIQLGQVQMNAPSPAVLANFCREFSILSFPFLFPTQEIADQVTTGPVGQELLKRLENVKFIGLSIPDFGFRHVTNSRRPINSVDDLRGLKIRTMENRIHLDCFRAMGANPTAMGWSEVFTGLQQGTIDGQENPFATMWAYNLYEVQRYMSKTAHVYDWTVFVIGKDFWDTLTSNEQAAIRQGAEIARKYCADAVAQEDLDAEKNIIASGKSLINEVALEIRDQMSALCDPIKERYAIESDAALYKQLVDEVNRLRNM